jgi:hypothetical protein
MLLGREAIQMDEYIQEPSLAQVTIQLATEFWWISRLEWMMELFYQNQGNSRKIYICSFAYQLDFI